MTGRLEHQSKVAKASEVPTGRYRIMWSSGTQ